MLFGDFPFGGAPFGGGPEWVETIPSIVMQGAASMAARLYDRRVALLEDMRHLAVHAVTIKAYPLPSGPETTLYFADHEFITGASDTPANTSFLGVLNQPIEFSRSMQRSSGFGGLVRGTGTIVIANTDGAYDDFEQTYAIRGREVTVRVGRRGDAYADMLPIFTGTVFDSYTDGDAFRIMVRDRASLLDVPLVNSITVGGPVAFAGTGGLEGGSDIYFKHKPLTIGEATNFTPTLVFAQRNIYMANSRPFGSIPALPYVYVNGVRVLFTAVYTTASDAGLATFSGVSGPPAGYAWLGVDLDLGSTYIRLGSVPSNQIVTMSLKVLRGLGDMAPLTVATKAAAIADVSWMATAMSWPADFDEQAFYQHSQQQPYAIGLYYDHRQEARLADAVEKLCGEATFAGFDGEGKMTVGVVSAATAAPTISLDETNILDIDKERLPDGLSPIVWRWQLGWARNWTDMTGRVAGTVTEIERAFFAEEIRIAGYQAGTLKTAYPDAQDRKSLDDMLVSYLDAVVEAERLYSLYASGRRLFRITTTRLGLLARFGSKIQVTHRRYGLSAGKQMTVISDRYDAAAGRVELLGFG